jgi:acyl carrier protein
VTAGENRTEILVRIGDILRRLKLIDNTDHLDEHTGLLGRGVGLDSIEVLQLVAAIEEEFELTIDDDELVPDHFRFIGNLITFIECRL